MKKHGQYFLQIQLSSTARPQPFRGWDSIYPSRDEALAAKKRALAAGYHAVRVVAVADRRE